MINLIKKVWKKTSFLRVLTYTFLFISCSTTEVLKKQEIEKEFIPYVLSFEKYSGKQVEAIRIRFANLDYMPKVTGICYRTKFKLGISTIKIDSYYWEKATDNEKEMLIWHELGHCVLNKDHNNSIGNRGCPISIMYFSGFPEFCYVNYKRHYIKELFQY